MLVIRSLQQLVSPMGLNFVKRTFSMNDCHTPPQESPPLLDTLCPPNLTCRKVNYRQQWIECPQPIIVKNTQPLGQIPFVKRKTRPDTASKCMSVPECAHCGKPKGCKYQVRVKCDRLNPPCPAFSEILRYKPYAVLTECVCIQDNKPLSFGYQKPCKDPRVPAKETK